MHRTPIRLALAALSLGAMSLTAVPAAAKPGHGHGEGHGHGKHDWRHGGKHDRDHDYRDQRSRRGYGDVHVYRRYDWNRPDPRTRGYYANNYYRGGYAPIRVTRGTRIYRGYDDRYYCRRSDGTTGLIVGAALGGLLGNQLDRGRSQTLTTVLGAGAGALLGREIDRGGVSCR